MIKTTILLALALAGVQAYPSRVVGGQNANDGQFPHQISLQFQSPVVTRRHVCGGSIINANWIMTAGHCYTELPHENAVYYAVAGITRLNDLSPNRQERKVITIVVHPNYLGGINPNDIALMKLETPLIFNNVIKPIGLPPKGQIPSGTSVISGWGSTGTSFPNDLQTVNMPILTFKDCAAALKKILGTSEALKDTHVCTGPLTGGISTCSGDSGGPLIIKTSTGNVQIGIVSWGLTPCGQRGAPSVYTRVSAFIDFINTTIKQ